MNEQFAKRKEAVLRTIRGRLFRSVERLGYGNVDYSPEDNPAKFRQEVEGIVNEITKYNFMPNTEITEITRLMANNTFEDTSSAFNLIYNNFKKE
jgi:hypothetical protein